MAGTIGVPLPQVPEDKACPFCAQRGGRESDSWAQSPGLGGREDPNTAQRGDAHHCSQGSSSPCLGVELTSRQRAGQSVVNISQGTGHLEAGMCQEALRLSIFQGWDGREVPICLAAAGPGEYLGLGLCRPGEQEWSQEAEAAGFLGRHLARCKGQPMP